MRRPHFGNGDFPESNDIDFAPVTGALPLSSVILNFDCGNNALAGAPVLARVPANIPKKARNRLIFID